MYDTAIIGGGPAGLTAAIYLARFKRKPIILTENIGGQTAISGTIENFPGYKSINGFELISKMVEQTENFSVEKKTGAGVRNIEKIANGFKMAFGEESVEAKTILITSGRRHRKLDLDNEEKLIGRGISYCATCDGAFAKGKDVVVIGGGYAATEAALILEKIADSVTMIVLDDCLFCEKVTAEKVRQSKSIKVVFNSKTKALNEKNGVLESVEIENVKSKEIQTLKTQMAFVEIGQIANSDIFEDLEKNKAGEIVIKANNETSKKGIYAAGDVTNITAKQTVVACGEGAKAAIAINSYLENI